MVLAVALPVVGYWGYVRVRYRVYEVSSGSMEPAIMKDEAVQADMLAYRGSRPGRGDVVVYGPEGGILVKRVIAVEGDTIEGRAAQVFLNGKQLQESYIEHPFESVGVTNPDYLDNFGPVVVPPGKVFLMGDNRDLSNDSRQPEVGPIPVAAIRGKVLQIVRSPYEGRRGTAVPSVPAQ